MHWSVLEKGMFSSSEQLLAERECGTDTKNGYERDYLIPVGIVQLTHAQQTDAQSTEVLR
jgi:hypothetical protein